MQRDSFGRDGRLLLASRAARMFGYGFLSVVLVLYLQAIGLGDLQIGVLLTATLLGDAIISLWLTTRADRIGRRLVLVAGALLMTIAGLVFLVTAEPLALVVIAIVGVISPSGNEVGPFLAVEQASLNQVVGDRARTHAFGWYSLTGSVATAFGALAAGLLVRGLELVGWPQIPSYQAVLVGYATIGLVLVVLFRRLSPAVEAPVVEHVEPARLVLHRSRDRVLGLATLFSLDAFAGGFVMQYRYPHAVAFFQYCIVVYEHTLEIRRARRSQHLQRQVAQVAVVALVEDQGQAIYSRRVCCDAGHRNSAEGIE